MNLKLVEPLVGRTVRTDVVPTALLMTLPPLQTLLAQRSKQFD